MGRAEWHRASIEVSDQSQLRTLQGLLSLAVADGSVSQVTWQPDSGEQGALDVLTVLASSGSLLAAVRVLPEFLKSRSEGGDQTAIRPVNESHRTDVAGASVLRQPRISDDAARANTPERPFSASGTRFVAKHLAAVNRIWLWRDISFLIFSSGWRHRSSESAQCRHWSRSEREIHAPCDDHCSVRFCSFHCLRCYD